MPVIDVPIGPGEVEFGTTNPTIFDITKGGIVFRANLTKQDITVDQYGDTPVKSIIKGGTCQVVVPFALNDLKKLGVVTPNSKYAEDVTDPTNVKKRLNVYAQAGHNLLGDADQLVLKPTSPGTTANDYITVPLASPMTDIEWTYNSDNERIANVTFIGYPDTEGLLYFLGDSTVVVPA
jgi:hypothetical protein